ncbi:unnamed protein product [Vicia faba]|uniref:Scarecrow-like protein 6 n=1 Tax=Vicia faba TaxID=3906 RepID=A0AAV0ZUT7_VICFA|nr:unnamed protein product [Vicia faba]
MKLPFEEFQVKGVLDYFSSTSNSTSNSTSTASDSFSLLLNQPQNQQQHQQQNWTTLDKQDYCYVEPTSVLDSRRSPSPPISSSTMSSSLGSGSNNNNNNTSMVVSENLARISNSNEEGLENSEEKCGGGMRMEDWEGQDQSLLRLIMGDVEDPSAGLNKILQNSGCGSENADFHGGFGVLEHQQQQQGLNMDPSVGNYNVFPFNAENLDSHNAKSGSEFLFGNYPMLTSSSTTSGVFCSQQQQQQQGFGVVEEKPQVINPNFMMNHNQVQFADNPSFFVPLPYPQVQEQQVFSQNQLKRPLFDAVGNNYPVPRLPFLDSGQEMFARRHQQQHQQQHQQTQLPLFPNHHLQQHQQQQHQQTPVVPFAKQQKMSSTTTTTTGDDASNQVQQSIFDQLYRTAELIEAGNPVQAQGILARLNHQLSPIGKPFHRAAFYTKEALQLMLHSNSNNLYAFSPINFIFKIGAYKAFSEISPVLQFANFTCNQALIEALERFDRIHVIDFDIGFGVQWSSFMQELVLRGNGTPSLKITAVVSPSSCNEVELNFTRENLSQYAKDLDMLFEFNALHIESLSSPSFPLPGHLFDNSEAVGVNFPVSSFINHPSCFPLALHFLKQLKPKVIVTLDKNSDRIDAPLPTNTVHVLQSYSSLLESLDAVNVNLDVLQKIERHFIQPTINKIILGHNNRSPRQTTSMEEHVSSIRLLSVHIQQLHGSASRRKELISISTWRC